MKLVSRLCSLSLFAVLVLMSSTASARNRYVGSIPNGGCVRCHVSAAGGGARNDFGTDVEASMPFGGPNDATWAALFCVDSDGDGVSNGTELGDPCGTWKAGDANPSGSTSNPGDASDTISEPGTCDGEAAPVCELVPPANAGGCASTPSSSTMFGLVALGVLLRRRRS